MSHRPCDSELAISELAIAPHPARTQSSRQNRWYRWASGWTAWAIAKLKTLLPQHSAVLPSAALPPALPASVATDDLTTDNLITEAAPSAPKFWNRPQKPRGGQPEGTKGAGSRSLKSRSVNSGSVNSRSVNPKSVE